MLATLSTLAKISLDGGSSINAIKTGTLIIQVIDNEPAKARWNKADDAKVRILIEDRIIDPSERHHSAIKKIHK